MKQIRIKIEEKDIFRNTNNNQLSFVIKARPLKRLIGCPPRKIVTPKSVTLVFEDGFRIEDMNGCATSDKARADQKRNWYARKRKK